MTKKIRIILFSLAPLLGSSVLHALPPGSEEPDTIQSYAICAAAEQVHVHFLERDIPLFGRDSDEREFLKKHRRAHKKELKYFEKQLHKNTSEQQASELVAVEKNNVLAALETQRVGDDVVATDELRKVKLDEWYTDFCQSIKL